MFDIGANLSSHQFKDDVKEVLLNAKENGVNGILLTSVDLNSFHKNLEIIQEHSDVINLKTTLGLHPHNADVESYIFKDMDIVQKYLQNEHVISIGEFGLDYFRMLKPKEVQIKVMQRFLDIAKDNVDKSLFLHERDAFEDFYNLLKENNLKNHSVVHCFSGNKKNMQKYLDINCYIGFTGWISDSRRNQDVLDAIKYVPVEKILIETDAPYLTPFNMENRKKRNEPANLKYVLETISEIKSINELELLNIIKNNTKCFFNFK